MGLSLGDDDDTQLHILPSKPVGNCGHTATNHQQTLRQAAHRLVACYLLSEALIKEPAENCVLNAIAQFIYHHK